MRRYLGITCMLLAAASPAAARDQIRIVGSSTVYPFVTAAAEQFGQEGAFKTPIVESTGTGGGFKLFCEGTGKRTPDISNASRKITDSERELCAKNGVTEVVEVPIGYDGIVLASKKGGTVLNLTKRQLFLALARELPGEDGKTLRKNPYTSWKQVDATLPDWPIAVYGPPPTSGTRDAFVELVMEKGCGKELDLAIPDEKKRKKACHLIREDGRYIESGEDDNIIVQKLVSNQHAFGILGYSFYEENTDKIQANQVEQVLPSYETIESGSYSVSRSLFVYVKAQHVGATPGLAEFMRELTSSGAVGEDGYVTAKGLLPLNASERQTMAAAVKTLTDRKN
jgi:phosphate transport system substrate-binding protein